MIDRLSLFSQKIIRLKPIFYGLAFISLLVLGYVIFFVSGARHDVYIIPCLMALLWSSFSVFLLSTFPYVPSKPGKEIGFFKRLKLRFIRGFYHIFSLLFVVMSGTIIWLTIRLLNIWLADY